MTSVDDRPKCLQNEQDQETSSSRSRVPREFAYGDARNCTDQRTSPGDLPSTDMEGEVFEGRFPQRDNRFRVGVSRLPQGEVDFSDMVMARRRMLAWTASTSHSDWGPRTRSFWNSLGGVLFSTALVQTQADGEIG